MNRTAVIAAIILATAAPASRAQQAAVPKPVHPTPIPTTSCRGCTDATSNNKVTTVQGYDDKSADTTTRKTSVAAGKAKPKPPAVKHARVKRKTMSKVSAKKSKATPKKKLSVQQTPVVLDPMIVPRATAKPDAVRK